MKFYRDVGTINYLNKIYSNKLTFIYYNISKIVIFFKNGKYHNNKNAASNWKKVRSFYLNGIRYGYEKDFTKESWRRFVKMQVFL